MTRYPVVLLLAVAALLASACGTLATPVPLFTEVPTSTAEPRAAVTEVSDTGAPITPPTATPEPPTATPEPPTATPEPPTATPEPATPTSAPMAMPMGSDPISAFVSLANPVRGEQLFYQVYDNTNMGPYACYTCHHVDSVERKIGPGLLGIGERGATRVAGESAAQYLYNSIVHPNDYIVEEYPPNLMPQNYDALLTDQDIYDIIAYLFTLR